MVYLPPHAVVFSPVPQHLKRFCGCGGGCPSGCSVPPSPAPACPANLPIIPPGMKVVQGPDPRTVEGPGMVDVSNQPLLVMFGGETCRITKQMIPVVQAFMADWQQHTGQPPRVAYVNASRQPQLNGQWGVTGTPTFFVIDSQTPPACQQPLVYSRFEGFITQDALTVLYRSLTGPWRGMAVPGA